MATIADFLSNLSYGGKSLGSSGGAVDVLGNVNDHTSNFDLQRNDAPLIFAELLRNASRPGGYLSDTETDLQFGQQASTYLQGRQGQENDLMRQLSAAGVNPTVAARMVGENRYDALGAVLGLRNQMAQTQRANQFEAQTGLANVIASSAAQTKQNEIQRRMFEQAMDQQRRSANFQLAGAIGGAALGAVGPNSWLGAFLGQTNSAPTGGFQSFGGSQGPFAFNNPSPGAFSY